MRLRSERTFHETIDVQVYCHATPLTAACLQRWVVVGFGTAAHRPGIPSSSASRQEALAQSDKLADIRAEIKLLKGRDDEDGIYKDVIDTFQKELDELRRKLHEPLHVRAALRIARRQAAATGGASQHGADQAAHAPYALQPIALR